jgi:hypothetical protein
MSFLISGHFCALRRGDKRTIEGRLDLISSEDMSPCFTMTEARWATLSGRFGGVVTQADINCFGSGSARQAGGVNSDTALTRRKSHTAAMQDKKPQDYVFPQTRVCTQSPVFTGAKPCNLSVFFRHQNR